MDFSWLTNIFHGILKVFNPLKALKHWKIWAELKAWYTRFKKWRDWYRDHVLKPMRQMQQMQRQIYNQFFRPMLSLVDHIRRLTSIIGLFNRKLANKLNLYFLRVETFLLTPFNAMTRRTNLLGRAIQGVLTPLGYLDRGTLLNSVWRDAGLVKGILNNPFDQHPAAATLPPEPTTADNVAAAKQYLSNGTGRFAEDVDSSVLKFKAMLAEI
jgi:hypothetical protein